MGTDAKDLFLEARYFLVPSSYIELNYDQTERSDPGPAKEERKRIAGGFVACFTKRTSAPRGRSLTIGTRTRGAYPATTGTSSPSSFRLPGSIDND